MAKRIFSLVLTLAILVSVLVPTQASAAAYDTYFVNAFDYGLPIKNSTTSDPAQRWQITARNKLNQIYFDIPYTSISYVELDFFTLDVASVGVGIATSGSSSSIVGNMTVQSLGGGYFKAIYQVNSVNVMQHFQDLSFWFQASTYPFNVTILSCRYISGSDFVPLTGRISVYQAGSSVGTQTQATPVQPAVVTFGGSKTDIEQATWYCETSLPDFSWTSYTGLDFTFSVLALSLTSCYAFCGDQILPCEISYINMPSEGTAGTDPDQVDNYRKRIQFSVHVDLTEIKANVSDQLIVYFSGTSSLNTTGNEVRLTSVIGLYQNTNVNFISVWFQRVIDTIKEVFSDIGQYFTELGDRIEAIFNGDAAQQQEMEDINSDMGDVLDDMSQNATLPSISVEDYDVGQIMDDYGADTSHFGAFFAALLNVQSIYYIFFMMLVFAFISYIIYGSK